MKFFTFLFTVLLILLITAFQFGLFNNQIKNFTKQINNQTAVTLAEKDLDALEKQAKQCRIAANEYRISAKKLNLQVERDSASIGTTELAIKNLAAAAEKAELPLPSQKETMTEEQKNLKLRIGDKTISATEVYDYLQKWSDSVKEMKETNARNLESIAKYEAAAANAQKTAEELEKKVREGRSQLRDLAIERDQAKQDRMLAELNSTLTNKPEGKFGDHVSIIQNDIDENRAATQVIEENNIQMGDLTPGDAAMSTDESASNELDELWGSSKNTPNPAP